MMSNFKNLLVIGGSGNLGKAVVKAFNPSWKVTNIAHHANEESHCNIILNPEKKISAELPGIIEQIEKVTKTYEAIICVAGGWAGGSIKDKDIFEKYELMTNQSVYSSLLAGHLATKYLSGTGLLVFTGAAAVFKDATPSMLAYSLAKSAVHTLALNLAKRDELELDATVVTILPKAMPDADFSKWAPPEKIAGLLKMWADGKNRPVNGAYALLKVSKGSVVPEFL